MENNKLQVEDGNYTRIINPLIENLIKIPFKGCELAVVLFIIRKTYGYNKTQDEISLTQFEKAIQRGRPTIVKAIKNLQLVNIVKLVKLGNSENCSNIYKINKYSDTWQLVKLVKLVKHSWLTSKASLTPTSKASLTHKRQYKDNTKDILQAEPAEFSFNDKLSLMEKDNNVVIRIIALYWRYHKISFTNKEQYQSGLKRDLRAATALRGYPMERIKEVMFYLNGEEFLNGVWVLETVHKYIDKDLNKLKK